MYRKADVGFHSDGRRSRPAINIKIGDGPFRAAQALCARGVDEKVAEQAVEYAVEAATEDFWDEYVPESVDTHLKPLWGEVKLYSEGRSGGWLVVDGAPDFESWDALAVSAWGRFEAAIRSAVDGLTSPDELLDSIEANRWAENGAERYNFIATDSGKTVCMADVNRAVSAAAEAAYRAALDA